MSIRIMYAPMQEQMKKGKSFDLYARFKFNIFKELSGEFSAEEYPLEKDILVEATATRAGTGAPEEAFQYQIEIEYPYGDYTIEYLIATKGKVPGDAEYDPKPLQDLDKDWNEFVKVKQEPIPKSMDQLKKEHLEEEEENKKREQEARLAQKRLEEEKARLRYE